MAGKSPIRFTHKGNFNRLENFLARATKSRTIIRMILNRYGKKGVDALREATPKDTGETANSWKYEIIEEQGVYRLIWSNTHIVNGAPIAVLLQYGHATANGGYVQGQDYINPAVQDIFAGIANDAWKEVNHERNR